MIRIQRPKKEPAALVKQRRAGLPRAFAALNKYGLNSKELKDTLDDYDGGKEKLFRLQRRTCAYCGRRTGLVGQPLEHVRPKKEAWRHLPGQTPPIVDPGYWWLTWTWSNHLFTCSTCNTQKKNYFPLGPNATPLQGPTPPYRYKRLQAAHLDTSKEQGLFIDPSRVDPLDHIEWRPTNQSLAKRRWHWSPVGLTPEGVATIKVLRLDALCDDVNDHIKSNVVDRALTVCRHVKAGHHRQASAAWRALSRDVTRPGCQLAGPTWNALHYLVELPLRQAAKLPQLPRP